MESDKLRSPHVPTAEKEYTLRVHTVNVEIGAEAAQFPEKESIPRKGIYKCNFPCSALVLVAFFKGHRYPLPPIGVGSITMHILAPFENVLFNHPHLISNTPYIQVRPLLLLAFVRSNPRWGGGHHC